MSDIFKTEIDLLCKYGNLGFYRYCEVTQIILINKIDNQDMINYFTHIDFCSAYTEAMPFKFISQKPKEINPLYQLAIGKYRLTMGEFKAIYCCAIDAQAWNYNDCTVKLDDTFPTSKKYIPDIDPTSGRFDVCVPIEMSLYGSNFMGNYYLVELFSKKSVLAGLKQIDIGRIQAVLRECKINYDIERLQDRIGNVVCKFRSEILEDNITSLGAARGIECNFSLNSLCVEAKAFSVYFSQEFDGVIYDLRIDKDYDLRNGIKIDPNHCKNTITVYDNTNHLILFMLIHDYTQIANYNSVIVPQFVVAQGISQYRKIIIDGKEKRVRIDKTTFAGSVYTFYDNEHIQSRQKRWEWDYLVKHKQLMSYNPNEHEKALEDIIAIINMLCWDLIEICIIDPYLQAADILQSVAQTNRENIDIKCLCDYSALHGNKETKKLCDAESIDAFKTKEGGLLAAGLDASDDLNIEFRTVYGNYGSKFHDRFLILKYKINGIKVWSLGASVNSIGSKHSIIQIVSNPTLISELFDELWDETENETCIIFKKEAVKPNET